MISARDNQYGALCQEFDNPIFCHPLNHRAAGKL
jgi:hypothetical protein